MATVPWEGVVVFRVPLLGRSESLEKMGTSTDTSSRVTTRSSTKLADWAMHTTVKLGRELLLPTLVIVAVYWTTVCVAWTVGCVKSPLSEGSQLMVAPAGTLAEISKVTSLLGASQSVNIK